MKWLTIMILISFTFFSIFGSWFPIWAQDKEPPKYTLGVIPFSAVGVNEYEAISLSNRLHSELVKTQHFKVVETEKIEDLIREQAIQQSGLIQEKYVTQMGNMLGAQLMATGAVGKVGRTYTVDVRIINVKTRRIVFSKTGNSDKIEAMLDLMKGIAWELVTKKSTDEKLSIKKNSKDWLWMLGSTVLVGGGIVATLLSKSTDKSGSINVIGTPPNPPNE